MSRRRPGRIGVSHGSAWSVTTWLKNLCLVASLVLGLSDAAVAQSALPQQVPAGTKLVVADQNEALQTLMRASGAQAKLGSEVAYANFLGGPAILEAFRAGALDLATVGNTPPIQAHAAGERILIVAARASSETDYFFAVRPGLKVATLEDFRGKSVAYGEGTARQPFVLNALKLAGLTKKDVKLVPLRAADFPDAIRGWPGRHRLAERAAFLALPRRLCRSWCQCTSQGAERPAAEEPDLPLCVEEGAR